MKKFDDLMSVSNEIENISASDAKEKLNDPNVQFIDVRDKESFSKGTIGNAIHLDRGLLEFYLAEGLPDVLSISSVTGTFSAPGIWPERRPARGSATVPSKRPCGRASTI